MFASVSHNADGSPCAPAVLVPLPVTGLVSRRVLVMDFIPGVPLNKMAGEMAKRGIKAGSPESKLAGRQILSYICVWCSQEECQILHVVRRGEMLAKSAQKLKISLRNLSLLAGAS